MKYNGACKSLHKRSYLTIIIVHARSMLLYQDSIKNTEASNHHKLNFGLSFQKQMHILKISIMVDVVICIIIV